MRRIRGTSASGCGSQVVVFQRAVTAAGSVVAIDLGIGLWHADPAARRYGQQLRAGAPDRLTSILTGMGGAAWKFSARPTRASP
jgi:hypothetical protein